MDKPSLHTRLDHGFAKQLLASSLANPNALCCCGCGPPAECVSTECSSCVDGRRGQTSIHRRAWPTWPCFICFCFCADPPSGLGLGWSAGPRIWVILGNCCVFWLQSHDRLCGPVLAGLRNCDWMHKYIQTITNTTVAHQAHKRWEAERARFELPEGLSHCRMARHVPQPCRMRSNLKGCPMCRCADLIITHILYMSSMLIAGTTLLASQKWVGRTLQAFQHHATWWLYRSALVDRVLPSPWAKIQGQDQIRLKTVWNMLNPSAYATCRAKYAVQILAICLWAMGRVGGSILPFRAQLLCLCQLQQSEMTYKGPHCPRLCDRGIALAQSSSRDISSACDRKKQALVSSQKDAARRSRRSHFMWSEILLNWLQPPAFCAKMFHGCDFWEMGCGCECVSHHGSLAKLARSDQVCKSLTTLTHLQHVPQVMRSPQTSQVAAQGALLQDQTFKVYLKCDSILPIDAHRCP